MTAKLEMVVGLEVHAQLTTASKLFCPCPSGGFAQAPNSCVCPVCTGQPGALPVLNGRAVDLAALAALALGCELRPRSVFARKNYFYPDMPKGYQISQYDQPLAEHGRLGEVRVRRVHIEEDAGKLLHAVGSRELDHSRVDFNRCGTPLIEIVSEPDIRSPEQAGRYLEELKAILQTCGVSRCDMEKGELRCDANVSVRPEGSEALGVKVEVKNLNSFRAVREALAYELKRQSAAVEAGEALVQETRLWDPEAGRTEPMRGKEEAHDYRYFPEPDLPPLELPAARLEEVRALLPELPAARRSRFMSAWGLSDYDAGVLVSDKALADYFEEVVRLAGPAAAKSAANWVCGELLGRLNAEGRSPGGAAIAPERLAGLISLIQNGTISGKIAKDVFSRMWEDPAPAAALVERLGLGQVLDEPQVGAWVEEALRENPKAAADLRAGKEKAAAAIVGAVMKKSKGRANPALVHRMIKEKL